MNVLFKKRCPWTQQGSSKVLFCPVTFLFPSFRESRDLSQGLSLHVVIGIKRKRRELVEVGSITDGQQHALLCLNGEIRNN